MPAMISITNTTKLAIAEQWDYYDTKEGPELANRWQAAVGLSIESLRQSPERGKRCLLENKALAELRWIPVKGFPFRIFYLFEPAAIRVVIVHLVHNKRDIADLLGLAARDL